MLSSNFTESICTVLLPQEGITFLGGVSGVRGNGGVIGKNTQKPREG